MSYWKTSYRTINGRRRKVRVLVRNGKIVSVRVFGFRNLTDKTARKYGRKRKPGYYNATKGARRANYTIHDHWGSLYHDGV
jgi:ribosomal protein L19E